MQRTLGNCDLCTTTTAALAARGRRPASGRARAAEQLRRRRPSATSRRAVRAACRARPGTGCVRLGYAGGTRTHQKDFATIAGALARGAGRRARRSCWCCSAIRPAARAWCCSTSSRCCCRWPTASSGATWCRWRTLPDELARFDVSLCPLERHNPFCEAKSELKYFESALAGVCLVATPTAPFRAAVMRTASPATCLRTRQSGSARCWSWSRDPALRARIARATPITTCCGSSGRAAWPSCGRSCWPGSMVVQPAAGRPAPGRPNSRCVAATTVARRCPTCRTARSCSPMTGSAKPRVTVGMTSYNYEELSRRGAGLGAGADARAALDLVVVDDGSRDGSVALLLDWAERNRLRFNRLRVVRTLRNAGLGGARNVVFERGRDAVDHGARFRQPAAAPRACASGCWRPWRPSPWRPSPIR